MRLAGFYVGDVVEIRCVEDDQWVEAVIKSENSDGSVSVVYDSGDYEFHARVDSLRQPRKLSAPPTDAFSPARPKPPVSEEAAPANSLSLSAQLAALRRREENGDAQLLSTDAGRSESKLRVGESIRMLTNSREWRAEEVYSISRCDGSRFTVEREVTSTKKSKGSKKELTLGTSDEGVQWEFWQGP